MAEIAFQRIEDLRGGCGWASILRTECFSKDMETWVMLIFELGFSQTLCDIGGCEECLFVFFEVFPHRIGATRTGVNTYNFFDDGEPSVTSVVQARKGCAGDALGIVHSVYNNGSFDTTMCTDDGIFSGNGFWM